MGHLVAEFPGTQRAAGFLHHAVFGLSEQIEGALGEEVQREREAGEAVAENAIANVAAGGIVAG